MEVCCPFEVPSVSAARYFVTFIDDDSSLDVLYPINLKSDEGKCYLHCENPVKRRTGRLVRTVWNARGGEYLDNQVRNRFNARNIEHMPSTPYSPHQDVVAKRKSRMLLILY